MYKTIVINFKNGGVIEIPEDCWDDYRYDGKFISIIRDGATTAMYNVSEIFSLVLEK